MRLRPRSRRASCERGDVRLTMGGEPTFVSIDDIDGDEWNTRAGRRQKRLASGRPAAPAARPLRAGRPAALRPGQMVSGRAAAALGASAATGAGTASRSGTIRSWSREDRRDYGLRPARTPNASSTRWRARLGVDAEYAHARPTRTPGTTCGTSAGCRSTSIRSKRKLEDPQERARAWPRLRAGPRQGGRLRAAAARVADRRPAALAERPLVPAARAAVPDSRRFADGLSPAARFAALGAAPDADREPFHRAWTRSAPRAACRRSRNCFSRAVPSRSWPTRRQRTWPHSQVGQPGRHRAAPRSASSRATAGCTSSCRRWNDSRTISTWSPPSKRRPPSCSMPVLIEGYPPPHDPRSTTSRSRPTPA